MFAVASKGSKCEGGFVNVWKRGCFGWEYKRKDKYKSVDEAYRQARALMVPVHGQGIQHPLLRRLFSARVLHPLNLEWSHPDRPGERYSLVLIDYGTYASFKGTKNDPYEGLFWDPSHENLPPDLVPLKNDRRSIRRIVISTDAMDKFWKLNTKRSEN